MTDRPRSETMMQARLRLLELAPATTVLGFLEATLDELETLTDSRIGFRNFVEPDGETLTPQAWSTRTLQEFCKTGQGLKLRVSEAGVWADAYGSGVRSSTMTSPRTERRGCRRARRSRSELVVPVFRNDRVVAVFAVGNKPRPYVEHDVEIVSSLADLAWDIAGRKQAEADLRRSEEQLRQARRWNRSAAWPAGWRTISTTCSASSWATRSWPWRNWTRSSRCYADLEEIREAAQRSAGLTQQLLAFARRQTVAPTLLDLNESVEKIVDMLRRLIGEDIELVWSPGATWAP